MLVANGITAKVCVAGTLNRRLKHLEYTVVEFDEVHELLEYPINLAMSELYDAFGMHKGGSKGRGGKDRGGWKGRGRKGGCKGRGGFKGRAIKGGLKGRGKGHWAECMPGFISGMRNALFQHGKLLVYCKKGCNRSASVAAGLMAYCSDGDAHATAESIRDMRPTTRVDAEHLQMWQHLLDDEWLFPRGAEVSPHVLPEQWSSQVPHQCSREVIAYNRKPRNSYLYKCFCLQS